MFDGLTKTAVLIYCTTNPTLDYLTTQDKSGLCPVYLESMVKLNWGLNKSPSFFHIQSDVSCKSRDLSNPTYCFPTKTPSPTVVQLLCNCLLQLLFNCCFGGKAWCCTTVVKLLCKCCFGGVFFTTQLLCFRDVLS